jgi:hypothetical protein
MQQMHLGLFDELIYGWLSHGSRSHLRLADPHGGEMHL